MNMSNNKLTNEDAHSLSFDGKNHDDDATDNASYNGNDIEEGILSSPTLDEDSNGTSYSDDGRAGATQLKEERVKGNDLSEEARDVSIDDLIAELSKNKGGRIPREVVEVMMKAAVPGKPATATAGRADAGVGLTMTALPFDEQRKQGQLKSPSPFAESSPSFVDSPNSQNTMAEPPLASFQNLPSLSTKTKKMGSISGLSTKPMKTRRDVKEGLDFEGISVASKTPKGSETRLTDVTDELCSTQRGQSGKTAEAPSTERESRSGDLVEESSASRNGRMDLEDLADASAERRVPDGSVPLAGVSPSIQHNEKQGQLKSPFPYNLDDVTVNNSHPNSDESNAIEEAGQFSFVYDANSLVPYQYDAAAGNHLNLSFVSPLFAKDPLIQNALSSGPNGLNNDDAAAFPPGAIPESIADSAVEVNKMRGILEQSKVPVDGPPTKSAIENEFGGNSVTRKIRGKFPEHIRDHSGADPFAPAVAFKDANLTGKVRAQAAIEARGNTTQLVPTQPNELSPPVPLNYSVLGYTNVDVDDYIDSDVLESENSTLRLPEDHPEENTPVPSNTNSHGEEDINIPNDSFSMFYVAETWKEHLYPVNIFLVQMLILALICSELMMETANPLTTLLNLKYPIGVTPQVILAQYIACLVSVFTATDFVDGIVFCNKRIICEKEGCVSLNKTGANFDEVEFTPSATNKKSSMKWEASNLMRMVEGALVVCVSFIFIVQSSTVLDLFLNFAAVTFVSELDDVAFRLSSIGFMGKRAHRTAGRVLKHKVDLGGEERNTHEAVKRRNISRIGSFSSIVILMWIGLSIVVHRQYEQIDACRSVTLTVGETKGAYLRHLSGSYTYAGHQYGRAVYVQDQGRTEEGEVAFIGYSKYAKRWTVTLWEEYKYYFEKRSLDIDFKILDTNCCYDLQSERTLTYDITEVSEFQHYSGDPIDSAIKCNECKIDPRHEESCGWEGTCKESMFESGTYCECDSGFYGESCQFIGPCTELEFEDDEFPENGKKFNLLYDDEENPLIYGDDKKPLMFLGQPTYILENLFSFDQDATLLSTDQYAVLLFDGGRWIVITSEYFCTTVTTISDIPKCLANFNPSRGDYYSYISEYSNGGTPENIPFRASLGYSESGMSVGKLGDAEFSLVCADCGGYDGLEDHCQGERLCKTEPSTRHSPSVKRCNCENGFVGPLCQTRPAEGKVMLYLEHDKSNSCSVCGENNMWNVWDLLGLYNYTCLPFPREPLLFEGGDGTTVSRQLGLYMSDTHFSVFVSNKGRFFPHENDDDDYTYDDDANELDNARELICSVQEGTSEIYSIERSNVPSDQTNIDLAVLLDNNTDSFGKIVDPGDIDCFAKSKLDENQCDGSSNLSLREVYDPSLNKTGLMRVWIQLDLQITA